MSNNFDYFPIYDPVTKNGQNLSDIWTSFLATHIDTLTEYLSQFGIFIPRLTTAQRDTIANPQNGQLIYNTSANKFQGFENGAWANLI